MDFPSRTTRSEDMTPTQIVLKAIEDGNGKAQIAIRYNLRGDKSKIFHGTIRQMGKAGKIKFRYSGGFAAVSRPDMEPDAPGQHITDALLAIIMPALETPAKDIWELFDRVKATGVQFHDMQAAIYTAVSRGLIAREGHAIRKA